ncbi:MAG: hypothetical protein AAGH64_04000 [Planctomycetota bacterium]
MSDRSVLLVKLLESDDEESPSTAADAVALGSAREVKELLAQFNLAEDGSSEGAGMLYGPGIIANMPMVGPDDPVMQLLVTMQEEDMAWAVLPRVCRTLGWKMMDPRTGRTFG